jgi:argininosuccinate lyase
MDAVADRDLFIDFASACCVCGTHFSRIAEDLILWNSAEFRFITLPDTFTTGSSLMPQKKNPDSMELLRGKSGRLIGNLVGLLAMLKGLPLAYNKDMQEDKEPLFDSLDTLDLGLRVITAAVATMTANPSRMRTCLEDAMLATDLADELVRRGMPFREAHGKVGQLVRRTLELDVGLHQLSLAEYQAVVPDLDASIYAVFDFEQSVASKISIGGTAPQHVAAEVAAWQDRLRD